MKKIFIIAVIGGLMVALVSFTYSPAVPFDSYSDSLRTLYAQGKNHWPAPFVDRDVKDFQELDTLPAGPLRNPTEKQKQVIELGRMLFFDPRLSGSDQISCATCHVPDLSWTDGRERAVGHDQTTGKRNTPSLLNVWYYKKLFWDGRSNSLQDQVFSPINNSIEMHSDMALVPDKLRKIKGYQPLFDKAFGNHDITPDQISQALAIFQQTITSRRNDFDEFLKGNTSTMDDAAIRGLHLFRTKARCINCHNGPLFSDNSFHNIGLTYYGRQYEDLGLYNTTKLAGDVGKFKTPSLRDVIRTRPWMHNGLFDNIEGVMNMYSAGMPQPKPKPEQVSDTLFPKTDKLIQKLGLTKDEKLDLIAFLNAITAEPLKTRIPDFPK